MSNVLTAFSKISTFVFDVDGVLTDGTILVLPNGVMARSMNIKDGYALQLAVKKGYRVVIITGGNAPDVQERLNKLGIAEVYLGVSDKVAVLQSYMNKHGLKTEEILYAGDDIPDLGAMRLVGLACCPNDAAQEIKSISHYISALKGGQAFAREIIEKVMRLQLTWGEDTGVRAQ